MEITQKVGIHNRFDIEVIDAKTGEIKQKAKAENVILDNLFNSVFAQYRDVQYFGYLFFGSGTGTPQKTDTQLFHHVAALVFDGGGGDYNGGEWWQYHVEWHLDQNYISIKRQVSINETQYVGTNITEVGIGCGSSATNLCTHAMLQDMNGNPISILKTNTDIITFNATVYIHISQPGMLYLGQAPIYRGRWDNSLFSWIIGAKSSGNSTRVVKCFFKTIAFTKTSCATYPSGSLISGIYYSDENLSETWNNTLRKWTITYPRITVDQANIGGIGGIWINGEIVSNANVSNSGDASFNGSIFFPVTSFYQGDNIVGEAVGTGDGSATRFKTKFDFPENAKVYVNGIEQTSGVIVRNIPCNSIGQVSPYIDCLLMETCDENNLLFKWSPHNNYNIQEITNGIRIGSSWDQGYQGEARARNQIIRNNLYEIGFSSAKLFAANNATITLYGSNNLSNWSSIDSMTGNGANKTISLDSTTGHYKYYKIIITGGSNASAYYNSYVELYLNSEDFKAIVFDTPPVAGDVVTIDYHTPYIAKDSDHVLDLTFSIQFGEYTPT